MSTNYPHDTNIDITEWISQAEAARWRNVTRQAIWKLVKSGRIRSLKFAGRVLVNKFDVESFEPLEPGRPRQKGKS